MSGPEFVRMPMARASFEGTLPEIIEGLGRVNTTLQSIATALQALTSPLAAAHDSVWTADVSLKAALTQIVREQLPIQADLQADELGLHDTIVSALGIALRAAYQAGVAATLRELRANLRDDVAKPR